MKDEYARAVAISTDEALRKHVIDDDCHNKDGDLRRLLWSSGLIGFDDRGNMYSTANLKMDIDELISRIELLEAKIEKGEINE